MLEVPLGKSESSGSLAFTFPRTLCCNCGTTSDPQLIEQDTRLSSYFILAGTEFTFHLPLPFCSSCVPTAKRRPKNTLHHAVLFVLMFAIAFLGLIVLSNTLLDTPVMSDYITTLALAIAALASAGLILAGKPKGEQTSHFQPVRIKKLRREFLSGKITGMRLAFTNPRYADEFICANQAAIASQAIEVTSA